MRKVIISTYSTLNGTISPVEWSYSIRTAARGDDVERLHNWLFSGNTPSASNDFFQLSPKSARVLDELAKSTGAIVAGRRTYDITSGWGGSHPFHGVPLFVVTMRVPKKVSEGSTPFTFVTDGIESAIRQAKEAAGKKNVYVLGGADVAQQCLRAGLLDEIQIHLVPVLLGEGIRLFDHLGAEPIELETTKVNAALGVTHLAFRVVKE